MSSGKLSLVSLLILLVGGSSFGGEEPAKRLALGELVRLVELKNDASEGDHLAENSRYLATRLREAGLDAYRMTWPETPSYVVGRRDTPGAKLTVGFYAHYDGQPVNGELWDTPPWAATLMDEQGRVKPLMGADLQEDWRLHARSTADDKGAIAALITAIESVVEGGDLGVNVRVLLEGEEEQGSPHLREFLRSNSELFEADVWVFCDGPIGTNGIHQLVLGARGAMGLELTAYGPSFEVHSGHYGNWVPNPGFTLASLLVSLRGGDGISMVPGFDARLAGLTDVERALLSDSPVEEDRLLSSMGLDRAEREGESLGAAVSRPAINLLGLWMGNTRKTVANSIAGEATMRLGFRLVAGQQPEAVRESIEAFLESEGFTLVSSEPGSRRGESLLVRWIAGYPAFSTSPENPVVGWLESAAQRGVGDVMLTPTLGGSIPGSLFVEELGASVVVVPIANHDNNQHAANENLRLGNLWQGVELYTEILKGAGESRQ